MARYSNCTNFQWPRFWQFMTTLWKSYYIQIFWVLYNCMTSALKRSTRKYDDWFYFNKTNTRSTEILTIFVDFQKSESQITRTMTYSMSISFLLFSVATIFHIQQHFPFPHSNQFINILTSSILRRTIHCWFFRSRFISLASNMAQKMFFAIVPWPKAIFAAFEQANVTLLP